jgi:hypothetical protein
MIENPPTIDARPAVSWPAIKSMILCEIAERGRKIGSMPCPRCESGDLFYCEYEGAISAACGTTGCLSIELQSAGPLWRTNWMAHSAPKEDP